MPSQTANNPVVRLPIALQAWGSEDFNKTLQKELESLPHHQLPLQQALRQSSQVTEEPFQVMILHTHATEQEILVRAGVFFSGIIAGCSCADDPTPIDLVTEHCTLEILLNRKSGIAGFRLLADD